MIDFDPEDPVAMTQALVRCVSVTPDEGGALTLLERVLTARGFTCQRMTMREAGTPDVENLYARTGSGPRVLCFAGHTDVVPPGDVARWTHPPFAGVIDGGQLWGRGTVDMKGGIGAWVAALLQHIRVNGTGRGLGYSLLITGDEEGPSINGTAKVLDWMAANGERIDFAVVGEPTNPERMGQEIKIGRRGSLTAEIVVAGKQGHVAYPHIADNPVPKLVRILDRLSSHTFDRGNADFEATNLEVTVIRVDNTATNVIPAEARAKANIRYNTNWTRPKLEAQVLTIVEAAAASCGAQFTVKFSGTGDVFLTKPGALVDCMARAVTAVSGRKPALTTNGGTSDARFIQAYCPVIEYGLINALAHHVDERVAVADLLALAETYGHFMIELEAGCAG